MNKKNADKIEGTYRTAPERLVEKPTRSFFANPYVIAFSWLLVVFLGAVIGAWLHCRWFSPVVSGLYAVVRIQSLLNKKKNRSTHLPPSVMRSSMKGEKLTDYEQQIFRQGLCPDCGHSSLRAGPRAGLAVNVYCWRSASCYSGFNDMGPFGIDRITDAQPGICCGPHESAADGLRRP